MLQRVSDIIGDSTVFWTSRRDVAEARAVFTDTKQETNHNRDQLMDHAEAFQRDTSIRKITLIKTFVVHPSDGGILSKQHAT